MVKLSLLISVNERKHTESDLINLLSEFSAKAQNSAAVEYIVCFHQKDFLDQFLVQLKDFSPHSDERAIAKLKKVKCILRSGFVPCETLNFDFYEAYLRSSSESGLVALLTSDVRNIADQWDRLIDMSFAQTEICDENEKDCVLVSMHSHDESQTMDFFAARTVWFDTMSGFGQVNAVFSYMSLLINGVADKGMEVANKLEIAPFQDDFISKLMIETDTLKDESFQQLLAAQINNMYFYLQFVSKNQEMYDSLYGKNLDDMVTTLVEFDQITDVLRHLINRIFSENSMFVIHNHVINCLRLL